MWLWQKKILNLRNNKHMKLEDLEKQVKELQQLNTTDVSPGKIEEIVNQLSLLIEEGETTLDEEIQTQLTDETED